MMLGILRGNKEDSPSPTSHCREYSKTHVLRHADACSRAVQSVQDPGMPLRLHGRDGGQRMAWEAQIERMSLGLRRMPDRAKRWRGDVSIQPEKGAASTVTGSRSHDLTTAAGVGS